MSAPSRLTDGELIARLPELVLAERACSADIVEHLIEIDRRRLYLVQACRSLSCYCIERLGYSEDEAGKRVTAARLVGRFPKLLMELRAGTVHLTGVCLLAQYLNPENYDGLIGQARGKTRRQIEELVAAVFPKRDVLDRLSVVPEQRALAVINPDTLSAETIRPGTDPVPQSQQPSRVQPLSASRWCVQFTAGAELRAKIEHAQELLSHVLPNGDLAALFERGLDALIANETKRRLGAGKPRQRRSLSPGSRHVPVEVAREVWERDGGQCTFVDEQGRRCSARRFLTIEHRQPFALGGPATVENTCLLCGPHNQHAARHVFGEAHVESRRAERQRVAERRRNDEVVREKAHRALRGMGFREAEVRQALDKASEHAQSNDLEELLRTALGLLAPVATTG
jgi:hypothetical protein